jgi:Fe-S-cluster containining protein
VAEELILDNLLLNRVIAYQGAIGRVRENFCIKYTRLKLSVLKIIEDRIRETAASGGKVISCVKGCSYCCSQYVGVSLEEAETIVYYLYKHDNALKHFIEAYPAWKRKIYENDPIVPNISKAYTRTLRNPKKRDQLDKLAESYMDLNIACPFLDNNICSIYEVRPWGCAAGMSTSPQEYCQGSSANNPDMIIANPRELIVSAFYYGQKFNDVYLTLPVAVNEILCGGTNYLSTFPGLENLHREHLGDPVVQAVIRDRLIF